MTIIGTILTIGEKSLFYKSFVEEFSTSSGLLAGFLSALDLFATNMGGGEMEALDLGKVSFYVHTINAETKLRLVIIADKASKDFELTPTIRKIEESIKQIYTLKELEEYSSQPSYFENLDPLITDLVYEANRAFFTQISPMENLPYPVQEQRNLILNKDTFSFIITLLKKDLAKILYGLFIGMRIVVTGNPDLVRTTIDSLDFFSPHRTLKKAYWVETIDIAGYDIIGVPVQIFDLYLDSIRINITKKSVEGVKSKNFDEIYKKIEKLKAEKVLPYIQEQFGSLFKKLRTFVDFINTDELSDKKLQKFSKSIDRSTLKVIESYFYWKYPKFYPRIKKVSDQIRNNIFAEEVLF